jgi:energy-coupling factor transporter ATP-binding protein EcfA2
LHIHTCDCPKASGEFKGMDSDEYVEKLCSIISLYPNLKMISFTDHNHISPTIYKKFEDKHTNVNLIPGIEVDTFLSDEEKEKDKNGFKHVIFYFNNSGKNAFDIEKDSELINNYLSKNSTPLISTFLDFLIKNVKKQFLLSPHFLKQGARGIEKEWISGDNHALENINKFSDQFFCFWESSGERDIAYSIQFLKQFESNNKISIIHFSDSNNFERLKKYLSNPSQYFLSMPTFAGLRLAGTDSRRIVREPQLFNRDNSGQYIGEIAIDSNIIKFSPKLNCIIGGRGSGKSLLLDAIELNVGSKDYPNIEKDRKGFIEQLSTKVESMNGTEFRAGDFLFDYYNQGYVNDLFSGKVDIAETPYFLKEFSEIKAFDLNYERSLLSNDCMSDDFTVALTNENIIAFTKKVVIIDDKKKQLPLNARKSDIKKVNYLQFHEFKKRIFKNIPTNIANDINIQNDTIKLFVDLIYLINANNINLLNDDFGYKVKLKNGLLYTEKSKARKEKEAMINDLRKKFRDSCIDYKKRVYSVNQLITLSKKHPSNQFFKRVGKGYRCENYNFIVLARELKIETLPDYLIKNIICSLDGNKLGYDKNDFTNREKLILDFCYHFDKYKLNSANTGEITKNIENLNDLGMEQKSKIYYFNEDGYHFDLAQESPGTRANILMEYLIFKDATIPLLIDQPEDNIDNSTIYKKFTTWFSNTKSKRQIIVATHDANIVVNSDSENVIVCSQPSSGKFEYHYGALEYDQIIDDVASILEGGRTAVERRINKYGEDK